MLFTNICTFFSATSMPVGLCKALHTTAQQGKVRQLGGRLRTYGWNGGRGGTEKGKGVKKMVGLSGGQGKVDDDRATIEETR
jgi:hypothetical protein